MRCTIDNRKVIQKGDTTSTGGIVLEGSSFASQGAAIATVGMKVFCPACKKTGSIAEGANYSQIAGKAIALEGHRVSCGCPKNCTLVAVG